MCLNTYGFVVTNKSDVHFRIIRDLKAWYGRRSLRKYDFLAKWCNTSRSNTSSVIVQCFRFRWLRIRLTFDGFSFRWFNFRIFNFRWLFNGWYRTRRNRRNWLCSWCVIVCLTWRWDHILLTIKSINFFDHILIFGRTNRFRWVRNVDSAST